MPTKPSTRISKYTTSKLFVVVVILIIIIIEHYRCHRRQHIKDHNRIQCLVYYIDYWLTMIFMVIVQVYVHKRHFSVSSICT